MVHSESQSWSLWQPYVFLVSGGFWPHGPGREPFLGAQWRTLVHWKTQTTCIYITYGVSGTGPGTLEPVTGLMELEPKMEDLRRVLFKVPSPQGDTESEEGWPSHLYVLWVPNGSSVPFLAFRELFEGCLPKI